MAQSIEQLMKQLGSMSYHAPSSYKSPSFTFDPIKYKPIGAVNWDFTPDDFKSLASTKKKSKGKSGLGHINLWDVLKDTLGQPVGFVETVADKMLKAGVKDFGAKDQNFMEKLGHFLQDADPAASIGGAAWDGLKNAGKEQWKDWHDGKWSWGDIPLVGALHGMGQGWATGEDIMKDAGVKNKYGQLGGGLALDIALDPLTYLTGGLSAATKLGKAAELAKTAELAKGLGLTGKFKSADHFLETAKNAMKAKMVNKYTKVVNGAPKLTVSENLIDRTIQKSIDEMGDVIKTARNTTYNAHVNDIGLSVPFTNKFAKIGERSSKSLLHNSEALAPQKLVDDLLHSASMDSKELKGLLTKAVQHRYGVEHTGQLTKTMYDDLHKFVQPIIKQGAAKGLPEVKVAEQMISKALPQEDFVRLMNKFKSDNIPWKDVQKQFDDIIDQVWHLAPVDRKYYGSMLSKMVKDYWDKAPTKNFSKVANARKAESMDWANRFMRENSHSYSQVKKVVKEVHPHGDPAKMAAKDAKVFSKQFDKMVDTKFNEMGDFKSKMGHWADKKNIFNSRTLASGDSFVNAMAEHISDANSQRVGEVARYSRSMDKIKNFIDKHDGDKKGLMEQAIYLLENHAPEKLGGKSFLANPPEAVKKLADLIKPVIDRIGNEEQGAGVLDKLRKNYFPHVLNHDNETMKEMEEFIKRHKELNGLKGTSKFNQERKTFQTLAQRDNYIAKLEKAIQKETDSDTIESLRKQQERIAKMFDTDVVTALQRRIKEGVRAKAMKELQGKLSKYGMFKTMKNGKENIPEGLKELSPEEAKKLGLPKGRHFIHPEVLNGMKRVDEIFTSQGMEKIVRHMHAIADIWRPLVTYYKPSHYINNIIGNLINNSAAGVGVRDYKVANKLIQGYRKGKLTESEMKLMEKAYKHNVISGGFLYDSHPTYEFNESGKLEKIAKAVGDNKIIRKVRHAVGEQADDISRLANFVNGLDKYGSSAKAAKQVRTYLFNYNELTNADRTMRLIVPFWNWTKRNIPLQMKLLFDNPKFAANMGRFYQVFNKDQKGADWQKESGIKIGNHYKSIPSPVNDLGQLLNPSELLGGMTPVIKAPLELAQNKKFFNGAPISYGSDPTPPDILSYLASQTGLGGNLYDLLSGKKGVGDSILNTLFGGVSKIPKNAN